MTIDEYVKETMRNGKEHIEESIEYHDTWESMMEDLEMSDSVTGNASGSYTFNSYEAEQNVSDIIWDEGFHEYLKDLGTDVGEVMKQGPEAVDVYARFWALEYYCLGELEKYYRELKSEEP